MRHLLILQHNLLISENIQKKSPLAASIVIIGMQVNLIHQGLLELILVKNLTNVNCVITVVQIVLPWRIIEEYIQMKSHIAASNMIITLHINLV